MSEPGWLLGSGLWVAGLALLLALYSYRSGVAASSDSSPPKVGGIALSEWEGMGRCMVCLGFLFASQSWLEKLGWALLLLLVLQRARARWGRQGSP